MFWIKIKNIGFCTKLIIPVKSKTFTFWIFNSFFILTMPVKLNTIVLTEIWIILVTSTTIKNSSEPYPISIMLFT